MQRIICGLVCGLLWLGVVTFGVAVPPKTDVADSGLVIQELADLSWAALSARLDAASNADWYRERGKITKEAVLLEMIRRGGVADKIIADRIAGMEASRIAKLKALESRPEDDIDAEFDLEKDLDREHRTLELITALNRIRLQPDPLAVIVDHPKELKATVRKPAILKVALKNVDSEKRTFPIKTKGDYRSGRHERWRVHVRDSEGNLLPHRGPASHIMGGWFNIEPLAPGER